MNVSKTVHIFLIDGTPGGLLKAEIGNWVGQVLAAPRSDLAALLRRSEVQRTGIYILLGDDPDSLGGQLAYVGEGDNVRDRLYEHARPEANGGKDFWNRAIVLTAKDESVTKADARYLESMFLELAKRAKRADLTNSTSPPLIALAEHAASDMAYFVEHANILLPLLGVNIFRSAATVPAAPTAPGDLAQNEQSPVFELRLKREGLLATAREVDGEFTVQQGSLARLTWSGVKTSYKPLRERLEHDGTLTPSPDGMTMRFTHDQVFASPSAAAEVVVGRSANGREEWKVRDTGESYGAWQSRGL